MATKFATLSDAQAAESAYKQLATAHRQNELYAAEMSEAKAAGFETAQDLFTSYKALQQQVLEQQAVIENMHFQAHEVMGVIADFEHGQGFGEIGLKTLHRVESVLMDKLPSQALTDHVNAEKVKMLEDVEKRLTAYEQHTAANQVYGMIAELTKDKQ